MPKNYKKFVCTIIFTFSALLNAVSLSLSPAQAKAQREKFVDYTKQFVGCPYIRGAIGPESFDCSGLIFTCSRESIGVQLPRTVKAIYSFCKPIEAETKEIGDLVFFKTTGDGTVSHVGIYMGKEQFIHCVSDGPNTGVIVSSLKENYWKNHYFSVGRFLQESQVVTKEESPYKTGYNPYNSSKDSENEKNDGTSLRNSVLASSNAAYSGNGTSPSVTKTASNPYANYNSKTSSSKSTSQKSSSKKTSGNFLDNLAFEGTFFVDWNFFTSKNFNFVFHGLDLKAGIRYTGFWPEPYIATDIDWEFATGLLRIPIELGLAISPHFRVYMGPVISIGSVHPSSKMFDLDDDDEPIKTMFFPGIMGVEFQTPPIYSKNFKVTFVQDIRFNFYSKKDNSALNFLNAIGNGLVLATGVRVIF